MTSSPSPPALQGIPAEARIAALEGDLAVCYRMTGADPDGNEDWRLADKAVTEVTRFRHRYDDLEAQVAALEAERDTAQFQAELYALRLRNALKDLEEVTRLRTALQDIVSRIDNGQRQSIGSIENVRAVQFDVEELERLRALLAAGAQP